MKKIFIQVCLMFSCSMVFAQWNTSAPNVHMTNVSGKVSIGTNTFTDKLNIEGTSEWQIRLKDQGTGGIDWRIGSTGGGGWAAGNGKFLISNSASSTNAALTIDPTNRIGIGTTSPASKLDVHVGTTTSITSALSVYRNGDPNLGIKLLTGVGDGSSYSTWNGGFGSWSGIGFHSTQDGVRAGYSMFGMVALR